MLRLISRRLAFAALVLLLIVFAANLGMRMARNSEAREANFDLISFSKLAWSDTRLFVADLSRGDLGSYQSERGPLPVSATLRSSYLNSAGLLSFSLIVSTILGLSFGFFSALRRSTSLPLLTLSVIGISAPSFFVALLLQQLVIRYTAARGQFLSVAGFGWDVEHMLLPVVVLAARPLAHLTRASYISLSHVLEEDYIRTAQSKGLKLRSIVSVHALRNVAVPLLTAIGVSLRFSLATLPVVEMFFGWPGLGYGLIQAVSERHTSLVVGLALALGLTFLMVNLLLDALYLLVDPRLREGL